MRSVKLFNSNQIDLALTVSSSPRVTLVTPSYQQGHFLEATIDSVLSQGYPNLEYRIIDGGSRDQSVAVIKRYARYLDLWISEKDAGQSDALIKGFRNATGQVMNWLNADDLLRPYALHAVADAWMRQPSTMIVGEDDHFTENPDQSTSHFVPSGYEAPDCLRFWTGNFCYHQPPTFFAREAYVAVGGLRADLHYVMDYDLYCRMLMLSGVRVQYISQTLSAFRLHPAAKTSRAKASFLRELREVSRPLWPAKWDIANEVADMNRYCAECSVYQAAESLREADYVGAARNLARSVRFAPTRVFRMLAERVVNRAPLRRR